MNAKEFVEKYLQDRQCYEELTPESEEIAKDNGLVVVFGMSDDTCVFRGAIWDDTYCYGKSDNIYDVYVNADTGASDTYVDNKSFLILAKWDCDGYSWVYETEIPHETFEVYEDGEKYCQGIVFSIEDIKPKLTNYECLKNMDIDEMAEFLSSEMQCCDSKSGACVESWCSLSGNQRSVKTWLERVAD